MQSRFLRFEVGDRTWALPLHRIREILEGPAVLKVPRCRPQVVGLILRRGVLVPVYDIMPEGSRVGTHVLVLEWGEMVNGLRVAEPEADQALSEEEEGSVEPPCRGQVKLRSGIAERLDLALLYELLEIPA
ncbi:MAG: chemotaxis protein CheW [Acidobacteria bacterium]|nr:chemotaxis protein CheW [Acidobacteriota bacterium]